MEGFVRYMPTKEPNLGVFGLKYARLYKHWESYLTEQHQRFSQSLHWESDQQL
ncbi:hypothetical protein IE339_08105 [Priestia koreensis]|nr:hypothetical protein IE339_08105 [Priestia koreensis]